MFSIFSQSSTFVGPCQCYRNCLSNCLNCNSSVKGLHCWRRALITSCKGPTKSYKDFYSSWFVLHQSSSLVCHSHGTVVYSVKELVTGERERPQNFSIWLHIGIKLAEATSGCFCFSVSFPKLNTGSQTWWSLRYSDFPETKPK